MLTGFDDQAGSYLSVLQSPKDLGTMGIQLFYGVALGLATLALLGVVLMTFCDKYKCRYLMYFSCFILFFFAILGFLISIVFSILVPIMYWGCQWLDITIGSPSSFNSNVGSLLDAGTRGKIQVCIKGGNGKLLDVLKPGGIP